MDKIGSVDLQGTTNGSGAATINADRPILGWVYAVEWVDGTLADGVDAVLSVTAVNESGVTHTLLTLTNANNDAWYFPRLQEHDNTGATIGSYCYPLVNGLLSLAITSGGATATGGAIVHYFR